MALPSGRRTGGLACTSLNSPVWRAALGAGAAGAGAAAAAAPPPPLPATTARSTSISRYHQALPPQATQNGRPSPPPLSSLTTLPTLPSASAPREPAASPAASLARRTALPTVGRRCPAAFTGHGAGSTSPSLYQSELLPSRSCTKKGLSDLSSLMSRPTAPLPGAPRHLPGSPAAEARRKSPTAGRAAAGGRGGRRAPALRTSSMLPAYHVLSRPSEPTQKGSVPAPVTSQWSSSTTVPVLASAASPSAPRA